MIVQLLAPDPILLDDPVRPNISVQQRLASGYKVYMWLEDRQVGAIVCITNRLHIPTTEEELLGEDRGTSGYDLKNILYSIWSYKKGCGQKLVQSFLTVTKNRVITMSPKTDMARDFHLRNGAKVLQENEFTINYEY
jgi:hypothetical protein